MESGRDLHPEAQDVFDRQRTFGEPLRQRLALNELEDQVVELFAPDRLASDVVQGADVGMVERGDTLGLALEARPELRVGGELRREQLQGHVPREAGVAGPINLAHAPRAETGCHFVRTESARGSESCRNRCCAHTSS